MEPMFYQPGLLWTRQHLEQGAPSIVDGPEEVGIGNYSDLSLNPESRFGLELGKPQP